MLFLYRFLTSQCGWLFDYMLKRRLKRGKEDAARLDERRGVATMPRPKGALLYLHAASIGEAQSALILIKAILARHEGLHVLVTTGTVTSARLMVDILPERAFHQFMPLDHPVWVERFLAHWAPDAAIWMESEFWPNMVCALKSRNIPAALVNARLSKASFKTWRYFKRDLREILRVFDPVLAQTQGDVERFGAIGVETTMRDNLKYSAAPLPCDVSDLKALQAATYGRSILVYASTHAGEEEIACRLHTRLAARYHDLLSIIIPRHPERGAAIDTGALNTVLRGEKKSLPDTDTQIYIADTLGELGLFYRLSDIVYVGRSLSKDGGGGHNPIEAAQLNCAVIHGVHIQNLREIYADMAAHDACISVADEAMLETAMSRLLQDQDYHMDMVKHARDFADHKAHVIDTILKDLTPMLERLER